MEFNAREGTFLAVGVVKMMRCQVERAGTHLDHLGAVLCRRTGGWRSLSLATQHALHARKQFPRFERLRHIVVGSHLQPNNPVDNLARRRQHYDGEIMLGPELARERKAVRAGQIQVHQNEIDATSGEDLAHAFAIARDIGFAAAMFAIVTNGLADVPIIVHHQNRAPLAHSCPFACSTALTAMPASVRSQRLARPYSISSGHQSTCRRYSMP